MQLRDELMSLQELERLTQEEQRLQLDHWRQRFKIKDIRVHLGLDNNQYYKLTRQLGLEPLRSYDKSLPVKNQLTPSRSFSVQRTVDTYHPATHPINTTSIEEADRLSQAINFSLDGPAKESTTADFTQPASRNIAEKRQTSPGLFISLDGEYSAKVISSRLQMIAAALQDEEAKFKIRLSIEDVE